VVWSSYLSLFIAVATDGPNSVMTSPDGITWTSRTQANSNPWRSVDVDNVSGKVAAIAATGTAARVQSSPDGITWTAPVSSLTGLTRGVTIGGTATTAAAHAFGATVQEAIRLGPAHPIDILTGVLENTDKTGCSIPATLVSAASLAAAKTAIGSSYQMEFLITAIQNAKAFIESQLMLPTASYIVTSSGKLAVVHYSIPSVSSATIDHDSIVSVNGTPQLSYDPNFLSLINSVTFNFDLGILTNAYGSTLTLTNPASISRYGIVPLIINANGYRATLAGTSDLIAALQAVVLARFANGGAPLIKVTVFLAKHLIEAGDISALTSALLPNRTDGTRGVTAALVEVINRTVDPAAGNVKLDLLWTS